MRINTLDYRLLIRLGLNHSIYMDHNISMNFCISVVYIVVDYNNISLTLDVNVLV